MMGKEHRLRLLQMGIARHDDSQVPLGSPRQLALEILQRPDNRPHLLPEIEPHIQRHLVVAASRGMELSPYGPDLLSEAPLDIHVDIFVRRRKKESPAFDFPQDRL